MAIDAFAVLYGQFRSYKSFIALDWALCLATGTPWCGHAVKQRDILYIAGEGVAGLKLRMAAWLQHHGIDGPIPGFRVIPLAVNLMDGKEAERLILTVTEEYKTDGFTPKLVIVDTLHRSMPGGDENSAKDMGVVIRNTALIQRQIESALLVVHHAGKDAERGLRGSSGLPGATDAIIRVSPNRRSRHTVSGEAKGRGGWPKNSPSRADREPAACQRQRAAAKQPHPDGGRGASCGNEGEADADRATRAPVSGRSDRR